MKSLAQKTKIVISTRFWKIHLFLLTMFLISALNSLINLSNRNTFNLQGNLTYSHKTKNIYGYEKWNNMVWLDALALKRRI